MSRSEESKTAKKEWVETMKLDYPDFKPRKWASNSYRLSHPQRAVK